MKHFPQLKQIRPLLAVLLAWAMALPGQAQLARATVGPAGGAHAHDDFGGLLNEHDKEIHFVENKGQFSKPVLFRADLPMGQAVATKDGMVITAFDPVGIEEYQRQGILMEQQMAAGLPAITPKWNKRGHSWRLDFRGASPAMRVESRTGHDGVTNYFTNGTEALDVRSYQEVWYKNTYRGIDVRYYPAEDGTLEYDIICKPGSDPGQVAITFDGIDQIGVNKKGELVLNTILGEMTYPAPVVYQRINGKEHSIRSAYVVKDKNTLGFTLGDYDKNETLVIDPIALRWATWMNTASQTDNHGHCIWVDPSDGAIYVVSRVSGSTDQITPGAFSTTIAGSYDMVVGKYLEPASIGGSGTRVWQTYVGGNGIDNPYAMEQGADGHLYITGQTQSSNFPLLAGTAFSGSSVDQRNQAEYNVYVMKMNTAGNSIKSAVIGGNGEDTSYDLRIADNGDVFVVAATASNNLATTNPGTGATNGSQGGFNVMLFRISQDLSAIQWMKNYGGSSDDLGQILIYDAPSGDVFIGGRTKSTNFPTLSPRQSTRGGSEAGFLQRVAGDGTTIWSSYFQGGSSKTVAILCMSMSTSGDELYFGGTTSGLATSNTSSNTYDNSYNGGTNDLFVARMDVNQNFLGSTYIGGSGNEVNMMGLNTDQNNDVYVFGYTNSTNFPMSSAPNVPVQSSNNGGNDKVFLKLSADLSELMFSTYYGGSGDDYDPVGERGIKFSNCRIYTIITSKSNNIPLTQGALNTTKNSSQYEPGIVVWANPPDLMGNTISGSQTVCIGTVPGDIAGSVPAYVLPTIVRNNSSSAHPSLGDAATYQWQTSLDSLNWVNIPGATSQNLAGGMLGAIDQKTYVRRIIGGDACILAGAADQVVTVKVIEATAEITHVSCHGANDGSITASSTGTGPFTYVWDNGSTGATISGLAPGDYTVSVTDGNGCQTTGTFTVTEPTALSASASGVNATCNNSDGSATVTANGGTTPYGYLWSNGATTATISAIGAGTYSVTVTDANGCTFETSTSITASGTPSANAGPAMEITCATNGQVTLGGSSGSPGVSYAWTATNGGHIASGANTLSPVVDAAGTYTLTVTFTNTGCLSTDEVTVTMDMDAPHATASVDQELSCVVTSVTLQGGSNTSGVAYSWSGPNGYASNEQSPSVGEPGTYTLAVTDTTNGCTGIASVNVAQDSNAPGASAEGGTLTCGVTSVQLYGNGSGSFSWSGPNGFTSTEQNPTVTEAGTYVLTVTGSNGCSSTATAEVYMDNEAPGASAEGGTLTCGMTSVQLYGNGNGSYSWSGPNDFTSNEQNPTVTEAGTYTLTVTGENGCSSEATAEVTLDSEAPGATAQGGTLTCNDTLVMLNGGGNGSFSWSGPNSFTSTEQNPTVTEAGTYTLTVTGENGCSSEASAEVYMDNEAPGAQATGGTLTCVVASVRLHGNGNGSFSWSGPNGFTSTEQNPTVTEAGTYTLTVTGSNGCSSEASAEVYMDNEAPGAQAAGGTLTCEVTSIQLQGVGNGSFIWSGPSGFTSTEQNPTVTEAGTYTLTVTGGNGCSSEASAEVYMDNQVPGAQAAGGTLTCAVTSIQLQGVGNGSFSWSGPNGFTSTEQNPTVTEAGTYTLTVTGENGCSSEASAEVYMDNEAPGAQAAGGTLTCEVTSIQLQGVGNGSFSWSGPNDFTSTEQNPTVTEAGTYTLTVTGENGCSSVASAEVYMDNEAPGASAEGGTLTCGMTSIQLQGVGNGSYSWSGPNDFTSNEQNPTVTEAGTYTLTVTGENGCSSQATAEVYMDNEAPGAQAAGGTLTCEVTSIQLQGVGNGSYSWSGPNDFTSTEQNPTVTEAGTYTLTVTGENGCSSEATAEVYMDNEVPGAQAAGGILTCEVTSIQLQGVGNGSYSWSGPNGFTSTEQNPTVTEAGTYTLTVTGENGCSSEASAEVYMDNQVPGAQAAGGTLTCAVTSIQLQGVGNGSFSWSGPNDFTSNEQNPTVTEAGTYTLTVTGENGCSSEASAEVYMDNEVPGASAEGGTLTCGMTSVQLYGNGNGSYSWSGPNGFTSNEQNPTVTEAGTYTLTVTGENGCSSVATAEVYLDDETPGASAEGGTLTCGMTSVQLYGNGNGFYSWSGPNGFTSNEQNPTVTEAGTYTLTVTGENGCSSEASAEVYMDNEAPGASAEGGTLTCGMTSVQLYGNGNGSYSWSGPNDFTSNEQNPTVTEAGTYTLTVTGENGCSSQATAEVYMDNEAPGAQAAGGTLTCEVTSIQLQGVGNGSFSWSGPNDFTSTEQNPTVTEAGTYTLTVTGENGCSSTATAEVYMDNEAPGASAEGGTLTCGMTSVQLYGNGNGSYSWSGPNDFTSNEQNPTVTEAGTYTLTVTGENGCSSEASVTVEQEECGGCESPIIISCPETTTVECGEAYDPWSVGLPVVRKNKDCPEVVYFNYYDEFNGSCPITVTRHWTFRDEDNNEETCEQTILIVDTQAPVLMNVPQDIMVLCDEVPEVAQDVWAEDCKTDVNVDVEEVASPADEDGNYTITRTFSATDACGNTATATQTIQVVGCKNDVCKQPIILACAPDTTFECGEAFDPWTIGTPVIRDNPDCPAVIYANFHDVYTGTCPTTVTRHWIYRDAAGNEETCVQTILIVDTKAPELMNVPEDITVLCDEIPAIPEVWAEDCKKEIDVDVEETATEVDEDGNYTIVRTFSATDECGHTATATQTIQVVGCKTGTECEAPIIVSCAPAVTTVTCGASIHPDAIGYPAVRKDQDCPEVNYYTWTDQQYKDVTNTVITRYWTFRDAEGNEETCTQTIIVTGCKDALQARAPIARTARPSVNVVAAPNPFRHQAVINFTSDVDGKASMVITDLMGHEITTLFEGMVKSGEEQAVEWSPKGLTGGLYFYRIIVNGYPTTGRIAYRP